MEPTVVVNEEAPAPIVIEEQPPLAIGEASKYEESKLLSLFSTPKHQLYPNIEKGIHDAVRRLEGGLMDSLGTVRTSWASCLGNAINFQREVVYMFFPSTWQSVENITKLCKFLKTHYDFSCRYVGEGYLRSDTFYSQYNPRKHGEIMAVRSHIVSLDVDKFQDICGHAILAKVSLIRYLYRPGHHENILETLYSMVESGLNSWDALPMAHTYALLTGNISKTYAYDRGLMYSAQKLTTMWPRSHKEMSVLLKQYGLINYVWSRADLAHHNLWFIPSHCQEVLLSSSEAYNDRTGQFLGNYNRPIWVYHYSPHFAVFYEEYSRLLLDKQWQPALNLHIDFLKQLKPLLKSVLGNPKHAAHLMEGELKYSEDYSSGIPHLFYKYVYDFIESFESKE